MNDFLIGDDIRLVDDPNLKGRVDHFDGKYVWVQIEQELLPFLESEIELDTDHETLYLACVLSACLVALFIVGMLL